MGSRMFQGKEMAGAGAGAEAGGLENGEAGRPGGLRVWGGCS